jgi:hypothetical protein
VVPLKIAKEGSWCSGQSTLERAINLDLLGVSRHCPLVAIGLGE